MPVDRTVYCFWTGRNEMPPSRAACLEAMRQNIDVPIAFLTWKEWMQMILPEAPLHPGFKYLSCSHRSDYLRCYFMHHFGGGYADIKFVSPQNNWNLCFDIINQSPQIEVIGSPEEEGGSPIKEYNVKHIIPKLLSNGWFICRPHSAFTTEWYKRMMERMDYYYEELKKHPATEPFGGPDYPVPWAAMQGEIFHRLIMEFRESNPNAVCSALQMGWDTEKEWR